MQGHRQRDRKFLLGKTPDSLGQAAGRCRNVAQAEISAFRVADQTQEADHIIQIIQRLSDAHQHDIRDFDIVFQFCEQHLIQHFTRRQRADQPPDR